VPTMRGGGRPAPGAQFGEVGAMAVVEEGLSQELRRCLLTSTATTAAESMQMPATQRPVRLEPVRSADRSPWSATSPNAGRWPERHRGTRCWSRTCPVVGRGRTLRRAHTRHPRPRRPAPAPTATGPDRTRRNRDTRPGRESTVGVAIRVRPALSQGRPRAPVPVRSHNVSLTPRGA
jgi:hypothetical protein